MTHSPEYGRPRQDQVQSAQLFHLSEDAKYDKITRMRRIYKHAVVKNFLPDIDTSSSADDRNLAI